VRHSRVEVEDAFRRYFMTGPVLEDWVAWSRLFTDDATYLDHFYGTFTGPLEIQQFLESTMSFAPHVYSALVWYNIDGNQVVYKVFNRADNPASGSPPIQFPSLQIIQYAGDGKWSSEEDWWILREMKAFNEEYTAARERHDPDHQERMLRTNWGPWVYWARPPTGWITAPSWLGREDVPRVTRIQDMEFGQRNV
jgi:hypothetical protein